MEWIFLDTSGIVALLNKSDNLHQPAKQVYLELKSPKYQLLTTDIILSEVGNLLSDPRFKQAVTTYLEHLQNSKQVVIVYTQKREFDAGLARFGRCADQEWGLTDCISFEIMREYGCILAFMNDHNF
jgi:predicted nucleic acid-binding protein